MVGTITPGYAYLIIYAGTMSALNDQGYSMIARTSPWDILLVFISKIKYYRHLDVLSHIIETLSNPKVTASYVDNIQQQLRAETAVSKLQRNPV